MTRGKYHKLSLLLTAIVLVSFGCSGEPNTNRPSTNSNTVNSATANSQNDPLSTTKVTPEQSATNAAPTLTPVIKAYCDAWVKNDEAALRKVHSSETLRAYEADMRADKVKTLIEFLEDDRVSANPCEVANEQITGDTAIAVVKFNIYPTGVRRVFVKEQGEWKLTNKIPDIDAVKKASNSK